MVIILIINILVLIFIYLKFYKLPKEIETKEEDVYDLDSVVLGYINDNGFENNYDLLLAEIIDLNIKGYIQIDYSADKYSYTIKQKIDTDNFKNINNYDILTLNYLFSKKSQITKSELEVKLKNTFNSFNVQYNEIKKTINKELIGQSIVDEEKQNLTKKYTGFFIKYSIITSIIVFILAVFNVFSNPVLNTAMYILEKIVLCLLVSKINIYTIKGQIFKNSIEKYKYKIEGRKYLINNLHMQEAVRNKEFANSLALHIQTDAKKAFINNMLFKEAKEESKDVVINFLCAVAALTLVGFILYKALELCSLTGLFWFFTIFIIGSAAVFDIAHALGIRKK